MASSATAVVNSVMTFMVGTLGLNLQGAEILTVAGRKSGEPRSLVVNPLVLDGKLYLLSPRCETNWVRNLREAGECTLRRGWNTRRYRAEEITDANLQLRIIKAYLARWSWQVKSIMRVDKSTSDADLRAILDKHPMFVLEQISA